MPSADWIFTQLMNFLKAPTWGRSRQIVDANQGMINAWIMMIDAMLTDPATVRMVYPERTQSSAADMLKKHRDVLVRCQQAGIARTFADIDGQATRRSSPNVRAPRQSDHRTLISTLFFVGLVATTVVGILMYNHFTAKPKIPKAEIPQITRVRTYQKGRLVYFRLHYKDPGHHAEGFGFVGVNGSGWAEESHPFSDPSYGIPGAGRIDYPFNLGCGTANESQSYVEAWIIDTSGDRSKPVVIHLVCKH